MEAYIVYHKSLHPFPHSISPFSSHHLLHTQGPVEIIFSTGLQPKIHSVRQSEVAIPLENKLGATEFPSHRPPGHFIHLNCLSNYLSNQYFFPLGRDLMLGKLSVLRILTLCLMHLVWTVTSFSTWYF